MSNNADLKQKIRVWDVPTRVFHWSLATSFLGLFITGDSERWRDIHAWLGYTVLGLLAFRLIWGLIGSRYARFSEFTRSPLEAIRYLLSLVKGNPHRYVGHNPAGAVAIYLLLALGLASGVSGWMVFEEIGGDAFEELHEILANTMLAVVIVHILGVLLSSVLHRENLVRAMVTGNKVGERSESIESSRWIVGLLLIAMVIGIWGFALTGNLSLGTNSEAGESQST